MKSTTFDRKKIQKCLELVPKTVDDVWKTAIKFNLTISQEIVNDRPLSGDIRNLDDIITILIPEEIVQKHKDELDDIELPTVKHEEKDKFLNLFKNGKDSGPTHLQNNIFLKKYLKLLILNYLLTNMVTKINIIIYLKMEKTLVLHPYNIKTFLKKCLKLLLTHQTRVLRVFMMLL